MWQSGVLVISEVCSENCRVPKKTVNNTRSDYFSCNRNCRAGLYSPQADCPADSVLNELIQCFQPARMGQVKAFGWATVTLRLSLGQLHKLLLDKH